MGFMGLTNSILTLTAIGLMALGVYQAMGVYVDAIEGMQPHLSTIKKEMQDGTD